MMTINRTIKMMSLTVALIGLPALLSCCAGHLYQSKSSVKTADRPSTPAPSRDRIDKFSRTYVCCKARDDFMRGGYSPDFRKTYFIQEGKDLVNTMFTPLNDSSKNLIMIKVVGDNTTFPLSVAFMEKTAYIRNIVSTMEKYYHFSEDSTVAVICTYNGKRPVQCPVLSLRTCEYIAKTLLKNALKEEDEMGGE